MMSMLIRAHLAEARESTHNPPRRMNVATECAQPCECLMVLSSIDNCVALCENEPDELSPPSVKWDEAQMLRPAYFPLANS
jgi:hypothetical protein